MSQPLTTDTVPLAKDADGVWRIVSSRVTLDTVVSAYRDGMTAEGIVEQYPSLELGDVYSIIGFVLRHPQEINTYLHERRHVSEAVRQENEARFSPLGVRDRLLARR